MALAIGVATPSPYPGLLTPIVALRFGSDHHKLPNKMNRKFVLRILLYLTTVIPPMGQVQVNILYHERPDTRIIEEEDVEYGDVFC